MVSSNGKILRAGNKGSGGVEILGNLYKTKKVGNFTFALNCFWSKNQSGSLVRGGSSTQWYRGNEITNLSNELAGSGWHVPTEAELQALKTYFDNNPNLHLKDELDLPTYSYDNNGKVDNVWAAIAGKPAGGSYVPLLYYWQSGYTNATGTNTNFNQYWLVRLIEDY